MALINPSLYADSQQCRMLSSTPTSPDTVIQTAIDTAINTAIAAGLFTCTVSVTGKAAQDIQNNMSILQAMGYVVSLATTNLTVSW
jgi:hypothetical protein